MSAFNGQLLASSASGALLHRGSDGALIYDIQPSYEYDGNFWHLYYQSGSITQERTRAVQYRNYATTGTTTAPQYSQLPDWQVYGGLPDAHNGRRYQASSYPGYGTPESSMAAKKVYDAEDTGHWIGSPGYTWKCRCDVWFAAGIRLLPHRDHQGSDLAIHLYNPVFSDLSGASHFKLHWRLIDIDSNRPLDPGIPSASDVHALPSINPASFSTLDVVSNCPDPLCNRLLQLILFPDNFSSPPTVRTGASVYGSVSCVLSSLQCRISTI